MFKIIKQKSVLDFENFCHTILKFYGKLLIFLVSESDAPNDWVLCSVVCSISDSDGLKWVV